MEKISLESGSVEGVDVINLTTDSATSDKMDCFLFLQRRRCFSFQL
jgi:hypothetical protein